MSSYSSGPISLFSQTEQAINVDISKEHELTVKRLLTILTAVCFVFVALVPCSRAQKAPRSLAIIYSNNINGEIDPCPT